MAFNIFRRQVKFDDPSVGSIASPTKVAALLSSAVWSCVQRITARSANARFGVYKWSRDDNDYVFMPNHRFNETLRSPSPRTSAFNFYRTVSEHVLIHGNAFIIMGTRTRDANNVPVTPLFMLIADPDGTVREEEITVNGRPGSALTYTLKLPRPGRSISSQDYVAGNVAHVKGPNFSLETGISASPSAYAAASAIRVMNCSTRLAEQLTANAAKFSAVLESVYPGAAEKAKQDGYTEKLRSLIDEQGAGAIPLTPHGLNLKPWGAAAADQQVMANLNWAVAEVARVYGVPLAMIQHTNGARPEINQLEDAIQRDAVIPLVDSICGALTYSALTSDERQRGYVILAPTIKGYPSQFGMTDMAMRLAQTNVLTKNEIRRLIGYEPMEDGDAMPQPAGSGTPTEQEQEPPAEGDEETEDQE